MYLYEQIHIVLVYLMLVMIFFHITGVLIEQFYHKTNIIMAMVSGYKKAKGADIKANFSMMFWGFVYTFVFFIFSFYTYYSPNNVFVASKFDKIDYKAYIKIFNLSALIVIIYFLLIFYQKSLG